MNTKALRQKILDLAIHGKLVPQDPNDEPASVLLERIKAEKERLIKEGKIKRSKRSKAACDKPHYPYELPEGWCWTTVDDIYFVTKLAGFEYTEYFRKEAISPMNAVPIVRAQNVKMGRFIENKNEAITKELSEQLPRSALYKDCLLMTFIGAGVGETCIFHANKRNHLAPNVAKIEPFDEHINMEYALSFFMSSLGQLGVTNISKSTAQASLSMATIRELVIPIPPIKEQSRIANEVAKWFSLIECIEENKGNLQETIKQTKSKILDLAIHGKLVPQDPTDEPASELLKRINPKAEITCDNPHYRNLPKGWAVCRLEDIVEYEQPTAYIVSSTDYDDSYPTPVLTAGKSFLIGHTNDDEGIFSNLPCIIFDDFTTDSKLVNFPFKVKSSAMKILKVHKNLNIEYVASFMSITRLIGDTHKRYWISEYSKLEIPLPPYKEQVRIMNQIKLLFERLDSITERL